MRNSALEYVESTQRRKELADFNHQMRVLMNRLMTVPKFHRFVIEGNSATPDPEPVHNVEDTWPSESSKHEGMRAAKERILARPHYQSYRPPSGAPGAAPMPPSSSSGLD